MADISFEWITSEQNHNGHDGASGLTKNEIPTQLRIVLSGDFLMEMPSPFILRVEDEIKKIPGLPLVLIKQDGSMQWDSSLLTFLQKVQQCCDAEGVAWQMDGFPRGVGRLLDLASAVPERKGVRRDETAAPFFETVGGRIQDLIKGTSDMLEFIGEAFMAFIRLITGRYRIRFSILFPILKTCSADALPIVSLISGLVGLILAFVGAVQLVMFGAQIYVASLVGIAMIRVMGAVMAGVIMAGRTGAAFAAQLGTMEVNEEIDALRTLGISPMEFLVMPRILSLAILMPLLCLYADLMGILGGMAVGVFLLDLNFMEYFNMTRTSVSLNSFWIGIFQSFVFGILVAISGCLRGMQCKRSASAVGDAATSAVVTGIVSIVIATAIITILCNVLGI